ETRFPGPARARLQRRPRPGRAGARRATGSARRRAGRTRGEKSAPPARAVRSCVPEHFLPVTNQAAASGGAIPQREARTSGSIALQVRNVIHRILEIPPLVNWVDTALFRPPMAASRFARHRRGQPGQVRQAARPPQLQLIPGLLPVVSTRHDDMNVIAADVYGVKNPFADVAVLANRLLNGGALYRRQVDLGF